MDIVSHLDIPLANQEWEAYISNEAVEKSNLGPAPIFHFQSQGGRQVLCSRVVIMPVADGMAHRISTYETPNSLGFNLQGATIARNLYAVKFQRENSFCKYKAFQSSTSKPGTRTASKGNTDATLAREGARGARSVRVDTSRVRA